MEKIFNNLSIQFGSSMLESLMYSGIVYITLVAIFKLLPNLSSSTKHHLSFSALGIIFFLFITDVILNIGSNWSKLADIQQSPLAMAFSEPQETKQLNLIAYKKLAGLLYLTGVIVRCIVVLIDYKKLLHIKSEATDNVPKQWQNSLKKLVFHLNTKKVISLKLSKTIHSPMVYGFIKPVIFFPAALVNHLTIEEVEAILIHELMHIKRNDYFLNIIKSFIETIMFFNPFVWLISSVINKNREYYCDEKVVQYTKTPINYAETLYKLASFQNRQTEQLSIGLIKNSNELLHRIKLIMNMKNPVSQKFNQHIYFLIIGILCISSLAWINPKKIKNLTFDKPHTYLNKTDSLPIAPNPPKPIENTFQNIPLVVNPPLPPMPPKQKAGFVYDDLMNLNIEDSLKTKKKVKIIIEDENGQKKEYNSFDEVPLSERDDVFSFKDFPNMPMFDKDDLKELKASADEMRKKFDSPEWKKQMKEFELKGDEMRKKFESPEWKKQMKEFELQGEEMRKKFESPEWKKQMKEFELKGEEMRKKFESPEWKKQMKEFELKGEEMRKKIESSQKKKQIEKEI